MAGRGLEDSSIVVGPVAERIGVLNALISGQIWVLCACAEIPDDTTIGAATTLRRTSTSAAVAGHETSFSVRRGALLRFRRVG
jgi:hypothetical protein